MLIIQVVECVVIVCVCVCVCVTENRWMCLTFLFFLFFLFSVLFFFYFFYFFIISNWGCPGGNIVLEYCTYVLYSTKVLYSTQKCSTPPGKPFVPFSTRRRQSCLCRYTCPTLLHTSWYTLLLSTLYSTLYSTLLYSTIILL